MTTFNLETTGSAIATADEMHIIATVNVTRELESEAVERAEALTEQLISYCDTKLCSPLILEAYQINKVQMPDTTQCIIQLSVTVPTDHEICSELNTTFKPDPEISIDMSYHISDESYQAASILCLQRALDSATTQVNQSILAAWELTSVKVLDDNIVEVICENPTRLSLAPNIKISKTIHTRWECESFGSPNPPEFDSDDLI